MPGPGRYRYSNTQVVLGTLLAALLAGAPVAVIVGILLLLARVNRKGAELLAAEFVEAFTIRAPSAIHADALANVFRQNAQRRAAYLAIAAERLTRAVMTESPLELARALNAERRYLDQHLEASAGRVEAAQQVEFAIRTVGQGVFLGWKARMDDRTSSECRLANGRNFDASRIPPIGYPGTVHPHCRCRAVAPFATALRVEDILPDPRRAAA
jgi:hypothetical protein